MTKEIDVEAAVSLYDPIVRIGLRGRIRMVNLVNYGEISLRRTPFPRARDDQWGTMAYTKLVGDFVTPLLEAHGISGVETREPDTADALKGTGPGLRFQRQKRGGGGKPNSWVARRCR